ncbi:MAG: cobalamin-independent methionine synthase II family protein [Geodermatophilaceae bacterium]|nr:cobalamin-independent methionine synthase II family protein [Geodermatophilaceae bacterium]
MKRSDDRILTTHAGSLPRPGDLAAMLLEDHRTQDGAVRARHERVTSATAELVDTQITAGLDVVGDGEAGKPSYIGYVPDRLDGFGGQADDVAIGYMADYPEAAALVPMTSTGQRSTFALPACIGPVSLRDPDAVHRDIRNLTAALAGCNYVEAFMTAASPGNVAMYMTNRYYRTEEEYLYAIADAMRHEYRAIVDAGFILQIDCPDLSRRYDRSPDLPLADVIHDTERNVEVLNHALADLPPDRMRIHICWGNGEGPHHRDTELRHILVAVLRARPSGLLVEGANPRHAHEWKVFDDVDLPDGKLVIPGVVDTTNNYIEHPELVAQRIVAYASVVGRENVIAGTDCGFATAVDYTRVLPRIAWAKLESVVEGARLASKELWGKHAIAPAERTADAGGEGSRPISSSACSSA